MDELTDRAVVGRLLAGDERAFEEFFADYFPRLFRFALARLRDEDAAEEVVQTTLVQAVRKLHTWRGEAALFTWLCQIARNELSDHWQRERREDAVMVHVEDDAHVRGVLESLEAPAAERPDRQQMGAELARFVQVALDHLPPNYATALELKYLDGLSVQEIAARLDVTVIAAQSVLARARLAFREAYAALGAAAAESAPFAFVRDGGEY